MPEHIEVWHKAAETFGADLSFARTAVEDLHAAIGGDLERDMGPEQRQKSAVIRIQTPPLSVVKGCVAQEEQIRFGLAAASRLTRFFVNHREVLSALPHG